MIHLLWLSLAIPIIIHMVHRRKAKPMPFSTLHFLRMLDQRVARRQRLRELLLLLARLAVLAALIAALERPILKTANFHGGSVPVTAVIILDNTASMQAVSQGASAFERARGAALQVLDCLKPEDSAALILVNAKEPPAAPTAGISDLRARIAALDCSFGSGALSGPLQQAADMLDKSPNSAKEVYVITDLQRSTMPDGLKEIAARIPADVPLYLVDAGASGLANLAITQVDPGSVVHAAGVPFTLSCRVENTGARTATGAVSLVVDGEKVAEQPASVAAGGAQTVAFRYAFKNPGAHAGYVALSPDGCPADDRGYFTMNVLDKLPVLLVDGDPSAVAHLDGAFFLRLALQAGGQGGAASPIGVEVVRADELAAKKLDAYACVILANVPSIPEGWPDRLADYVRRGGGLLIFCGARVDPFAYNSAIGPAALEPRRLVPATLGEIKSPGSEPDAKPFRIQRADREHPALRDIVSGIDFGTTQVTGLLTATPAGNDSAVLISTDAGPLMVERRFGAGRVILCATSGTTAMSNMPLKPYFLPLMHQLVYYMGRAAGDAAPVQVGMAKAVTAPGQKPVDVRITPPLARADEKPATINMRTALAAGENRALFTATNRPGIYRVDYAAAASGHAQPDFFAVNILPAETDLSRWQPDEAKSRLGRANIIFTDKPDALGQVVRTQREGLPLWDYLLLATLIIAVVEVFLANMFVKH